MSTEKERNDLRVAMRGKLERQRNDMSAQTLGGLLLVATGINLIGLAWRFSQWPADSRQVIGAVSLCVLWVIALAVAAQWNRNIRL